MRRAEIHQSPSVQLGTWIAAIAICSTGILGCPSAGCPEPLPISGVYQERVNCDEANMCVIEDEMDMVTVETDSEDPALFTLASLLTGLLGDRMSYAIVASSSPW